jgi:uncharacterized SAM-binding protein YcdF (DUF218 family)
VAGWGLVLAALALAVATTPPVVALRKIVGIALMPTTLVWLLLIALLVRSWREPRWRRIHAIALAAYTAAGSPWSSYLFLSSLESPFRSLRPLAEPTTYDAVAVMGGGSSLTPSEAPQLNMSGDRIRLGATIFAQGRTPLLVTSGSTVDGERDVSAETAAIWTQMGIPEDTILRVPRPRNSAQEIVALAQLASERGWKRFGLVTSARHLPRVLALCERYGLEVVPLPADFRADPPAPGILGVVPTGDGFADVGYAAWEYLGIAAVHLFGG